jgi:hypothetical protein
MMKSCHLAVGKRNDVLKVMADGSTGGLAVRFVFTVGRVFAAGKFSSKKNLQI